MANEKKLQEIIDKLSTSITDDVGNTRENELDTISTSFDDTLNKALRAFNSSTFDDDGFIKKMRGLSIGEDDNDKGMIKGVLNNIRSDYVSADSLNQSELLLKRDINNICTQMPEMRDVVNVIRDAIIECNVATGEVSRTLLFENSDNDEEYQTRTRELEERFDILMAIKNFIVPNTLKNGELPIQVTPYAKLFAELEAIHDTRYSNGKKGSSMFGESFKESIPDSLMESFDDERSLYSEDNLKTLMESVGSEFKVDITNDNKIASDNTKITAEKVTKDNMRNILENISVYNGSSVLMAENGIEGFKELLLNDYFESKTNGREEAFMERLNFAKPNQGLFANVDQDAIDFSSYSDIKGCYIKYLDPLKTIPITLDKRVIGYYYVTTTMDLQRNSANPNGIVDLSFQNYARDRNMVSQLANMIIKSFDKKMLEKNVRLKNEIAEIIMAHRFSEGKLSFIYIPENEVIRLVINQDENGKGHSIIEPTIFPARMYLMLTLYNMLYTLNNNTTRIHYLKSSGLNKDYASQIQRTMRKFQQRRITIDDIYSYSGVLNKVGGMGEMVLPAGRNDYKALETDTIEAVQNPISIEFLEQQRRQALSGTGAPHLLIINAIDEVDFAKTLEMANTRFLSTVSSYKIDFNKGLTKLYQAIMKACTDMEPEVIRSFRFKFNAIKQQELVITADMIQNFNSMVEVVESIYYSKSDVEDKDGNPTSKRIILRREMAKKYLPQLDFDELEKMIEKVDLDTTDDQLQLKVNQLNINKDDLEEVEK